MAECRHYIERLYVPEGWKTDITEITDAASMASGYNRAAGIKPGDMPRTEGAPIRIYLHQDVFILNRWFLHNLLALFTENEKTGLAGMAGTPKLHESGVMWLGEYVGNVYTPTDEPYEEEKITGSCAVSDVESVDGFLMATCADIPWREDLFDGFDFYDVSQSREFLKQGFRVIVPEQKSAWCVHDDGRILNLYRYNHYRKLFLANYGK